MIQEDQMRTRTLPIAGGIVALAGIGFAALGSSPAFASGSPVAITATVNQTISMTGPPATLALAGNPGTNATSNISYTVATNDPSGYDVTISPSAVQLANGGNNIPNADMGYVPNGGAQVQFSGATPITVNNKSTVSGTGGDNYTDTFTLAIPANAAAGAYTETFTYLAVAK
jgi:hypothetical protein